MFLAFAFAYFLSTLLRAVTATLAPVLRQDFGLSEGDLGLLAGAYFLGFSLTQLPLGAALDRYGSRRVLMVLLGVASVACLAFAQSQSLSGLILARMLIGVGVSACLMAPLTAYRLHYAPAQQLRANAWMLMTGSLGMLASTLPVHGLVPLMGWRGLFVMVAGLLVVAAGLVAWLTPVRVQAQVPAAATTRPLAPTTPAAVGYAAIFRHPRFVQLLPVGLFMYGGMMAVQTLWAGPWLTRVVGQSAQAAAQGLFFISVATLATFFVWGVITPRMAKAGVNSYRVMRVGLVLPLALMVLIIGMGPRAGAWAWGAWLVASSVITLSQPLLAQEFPPSLAGRALSAYNLVLFVGVFVVQWGLGLIIDGLLHRGWSVVAAYQGAFGVYAALCFVSFAWYLVAERRSAPIDR
jgi:MFS family permease